MAHGGKREGAGRPASKPHLKSTARSITMPQWAWDEIDKIPQSRSGAVLAAVVEHYGLKPPEDAG